jgi:SAM-dependent methyltransferase
MGKISEQAAEIRKIWGGFGSARVLITANNYRVFDYLEEYKTAGGLAKRLKTDKRATVILLDALAGLGLLKKQKDRYKNTGLSSRFLVSGTPYYQGNIIKHGDGLWDRWSDLDRVLQTGKPSRRSRDFESFILGMHNISVLKVKEVVREINLKGVRKILDLGGGPGTYSAEMAKKGVHVTLFDTPEAIKIARKNIYRIQKNIKDIDFIGGDFFIDDIGSGYDLIFMSQVIHAYSYEDNLKIFRICRRALNSGGRLAVHEFLINESRTRPAQGSLFAVNMLVNTDGGRTYSPGDIKSMFLKAGFGNMRKKIVAEGVLVSAERD